MPLNILIFLMMIGSISLAFVVNITRMLLRVVAFWD